MIRRVIPATPTGSSVSTPTEADDDPAAVTIEASYAGPLGSHADMPWVGLCMVSSVDGSTVVDGRSAELSSDNDIAVLLTLRSIADVILVGAGTVRDEGYGPPKTPGQRLGVVTASGNVDLSTPLFTSGAGFVVTTEQTELPHDHGVQVLRVGTDGVDLRDAIDRLGEIHHDPRFVQVEGGASLNGSMLDADIFDEINVTTSPLCVGGSGPRVTSGAQDHAHRYELAQMLVDDESFVFSRWRRRR